MMNGDVNVMFTRKQSESAESEPHAESESLTSSTVTKQKAFDQKACSYNSHSYFCIS